MFWIQNSSLSCSSVRSSWITIQMTSHDHQWIISGALSVLTFACRLTWVFAANIKNRHRDKTFNCSVETVHSSRLSHTHLHLSASSPLPASFHPHLYIFNTLPEKYTVIHIHDLFMFMHALRRWKAIISCLSYLLLALWVCVDVSMCVSFAKGTTAPHNAPLLAALWKKTLLLWLMACSVLISQVSSCKHSVPLHYSDLFLAGFCWLINHRGLGDT